jgi:hypothetical protein
MPLYLNPQAAARVDSGSLWKGDHLDVSMQSVESCTSMQDGSDAAFYESNASDISDDHSSIDDSSDDDSSDDDSDASLEHKMDAAENLLTDMGTLQRGMQHVRDKSYR